MRDAGWESMTGALLQDLRYGARLWRRAPGFALIAIATLALGIGANTALFSIVNAVLLRPLPYPDPARLVTVHESKPNFDRGSISWPNFLDWQTRNRSFDRLAVSRENSFDLTGGGAADRVTAQFITTDFFPILGIAPLRGRLFAPGEDAIGGPPIVLLSEGLWRRRFASAEDITSRAVALDGKPYRVVGIIPDSFSLRLGTFSPADVYAPIGQWDNPALKSRQAGLGIHGIGRLKPGVSIETAREDMARVTGALALEYPGVDKGVGASLIPLDASVLRGVQTNLWILLGAVGLVLLIACVNVGNLLLARSTSRARELAVRASLGASRGRVVRQLLAESLLLSLAGGATGLLLAVWAVRALPPLLGGVLPRATEISLDAPVLWFTLAVSILTGVGFGLTPALRASHGDLRGALDAGGRGRTSSRGRTLGAFVVVEVALASVLLVGAGLLLRTLGALWQVDPGFDSHHVLTFTVSMPPSARGADTASQRTALRDLSSSIARHPGVEAAALSWGATPMLGDDENLFWVDGQPKPATQDEMKWAINYVVEDAYLAVMRTPLIRGRFFTPQDDDRAPAVVVIDDVFAAQYFPHQDPIGRRLHVLSPDRTAEIVGIVAHVKQWGLDADDTQALRAQLYSPFRQLPPDLLRLSWNGVGVLARTTPRAGATADDIRQSLQRSQPDENVFGAQTMDDAIGDTLQIRELSMAVLGGFAALAILLAAIGIYGVLAHRVSERTAEIGLRLALGAQRRDVLVGVLRNGLSMTLAGAAIGIVGALGVTRLMTTMLYGVRPMDPITYASVACGVTAVALLACVIPARRAMRVDPASTLRG